MTSHCSDTSEAIELYPPRCLFLKPLAKIHISVQLPVLKTAGKSISNWEVMEKVKTTVKPERFVALKVVKSALEFVRLEGELESRALIQRLIGRLDGSTMKLSGYPEQLRVRAAEARHMFPARHDWDSYFRGGAGCVASTAVSSASSGAPGPEGSQQRPDTVHIRDLPCKWFAATADRTWMPVPPVAGADRPSEDVVRQVFETFGEVRSVDVPMLDPYREEVASVAARAPGSIATFSFSQDLNFEAFIQYKEYISFVRALEGLKGMRLLYKSPTDGKAYTANIKVDFDKTRHMSEKAIKKRRLEREKLEQLEKEREEKKRQEREADERRKEDERRSAADEASERARKRAERELRRHDKERARQERRERKQHESEQRAKDEARHEEEERRLQEEERRRREEAEELLRQLAEQRSIESVRLLTELLQRAEKVKIRDELLRREHELKEKQERLAEEEQQKRDAERLQLEEEQRRKREVLERQERDLREKMVQRMREAEERRQEERREQLRRKIAGQVRLRSTVIMKK